SPRSRCWSWTTAYRRAPTRWRGVPSTRPGGWARRGVSSASSSTRGAGGPRPPPAPPATRPSTPRGTAARCCSATPSTTRRRPSCSGSGGARARARCGAWRPGTRRGPGRFWACAPWTPAPPAARRVCPGGRTRTTATRRSRALGSGARSGRSSRTGWGAGAARPSRAPRVDDDELERLAGIVPVGDDGTLDVAELEPLPEAVRTRVLRRWLRSHGVSSPTYVHLAAVSELVTGWRGQGGVAVGGRGVPTGPVRPGAPAVVARLVARRRHGKLCLEIDRATGAGAA